MFESRDSGILLGGLIRSRAIGEANARAAEQAHESAWSWRRRSTRLESRVRELEQELALKTAAVEGMSAQLAAVYETHPDSPLLRAGAGRYRDGGKKAVIREVFEAAFDTAAKRLGVRDPASMRLG